MKKITQYFLTILLGLSIFLPAGCSKKNQAMPKNEPVPVSVLPVLQRRVPVYVDFVGQVAAIQEVDLRAQVSGFLTKKSFQDGALVKKGDVLFSIDPRPFQAALADAKAKLAQAESLMVKAQQDAARYNQLARENATSQISVESAIAQEKAAVAAVEAMKAVVEQAALDLEHATICSPVDGRIGRSQIDVGGFVQASATVLATVSVIDPIRVYFNISEREYLGMARSAATNTSGSLEKRNVHLILTDGQLYPYKGHIDFTDRSIAPLTGTLTLRAEFPNPNELLRPGLFGRVRTLSETREGALLVPKRAVQEIMGKTFLTLVNSNKLVEGRSVVLGPQIGELWVVDSGVSAGETVIVDGFQKVRNGQPVNATLLDEKKFVTPHE